MLGRGIPAGSSSVYERSNRRGVSATDYRKLAGFKEKLKSKMAGENNSNLHQGLENLDMAEMAPTGSLKTVDVASGGSRISRWGGADPLGGADLQRVHFLAKTKEIDPVGGGPGGAPLDPPMVAT